MRESGEGLNGVTVCSIKDKDVTGVITVGQGLLAGPSTPLLLQAENSMSPLSSSPARSSPMAPRICRESPPTKQPSDQAPAAEDFSIKNLISPVEVNDDSPEVCEPLQPQIILERCDTMKEEAHGESQPSSASLAESANTFGFQMRQISCRSSERGASPARAEDSARSRSPTFVLEPMAVAEAHSVESTDELQS